MPRTAHQREFSLGLSPRCLSLSDVSPDDADSEQRRSKRSIPRLDTPLPSHPARKRVNPESLAARLGSKLIEELEALLVPDMTEMPPFAVRQALQKRYNINRRHIYDWFHSKGLRVTKEEARPEEEAVVRPRKIQRQIGRYGASVSPSPFMPSVALAASQADVQFGLVPSGSIASVDIAGPFSGGSGYLENLPFPASLVPPSQLLALDGLDFLSNLSSSLSQSDTDLSDLGSPEKLAVPGLELDNLRMIPPSSVNDSPPSPVLSVSQGDDPLLSLDTGMILSPPERQAIYENLSCALGPAYGIQESVGTYKSFMLQQRQMYYERLIPDEMTSATGQGDSELGIASTYPSTLPAQGASMPRASVSGGPHVEPHNTMVRSEASSSSPAMSEFHGWYPGGGFSRSSSLVSSRMQTPDLSSDASVDARLWASGRADYSSCSGLVLDLGDVLESPVLRSRNASADRDAFPVSDSAANRVQEWRVQDPRAAWVYPAACLPYGVPPPAPLYHPVLLRHSQSWEDPRVAQYAHFPAVSAPRWEQGDFGRALQDASASCGLEKAGANRSKDKGLPRRTRTQTNTGAAGL